MYNIARFVALTGCVLGLLLSVDRAHAGPIGGAGGGASMLFAADCLAGTTIATKGQQCVDSDNGNLYTCANPQLGGAITVCDNGADWFLNSASSAAGVSTFAGRAGAVVPTAGDYSTTQVTASPYGNLIATTTQAALQELDDEKHPLMTNPAPCVAGSYMNDWNADGTITCGQPTAIQVVSTATGTLSATTVQEALAELDNDKHPIMGDPAPCAAGFYLNDWNNNGTVTCGQPTATQVVSNTTGTITATTVQGAIQQLEANKQPLDSDTLSPLATKNLIGTGPAVRLSTGTFTTDDCVKVDADGNLVTAGAACGTSTGGVIDRDYGDIIVSDGGITWQIEGDAVSNAKLANVPTATLKGRTTGGSGDPEDLIPSQVRTLLNVADGANNYVHPNHTGDVASLGDGATTINADVISNAKLANVNSGTFKGRSTAGTGDPEDLTAAQARTLLNVENGANAYVHPNHTGDVTSVGDGATTIANNAVSNAKAATMANGTIKGRTSAGTGNPEDLTATQATALLNTFTTSAKGLVPAPVTSSATKYLRDDGQWIIPPASSVSDGTYGDISVSGTTWTVVSGSVTAPEVPYTPTGTGDLSSTNVDAAIDELDTEKQTKDQDLVEMAATNCSNGEILKQTAGVWACGADATAAGGAGDVVGPGAATDNAIALFSGTGGKTIKNSTVTVDSSGNLSTAGAISSGSGSSTAGYLALTEGTAPTAAPANTIQLEAPTDVTTPYDLILPPAGAPATPGGFLRGIGSGATTALTFSTITDADIPNNITASNYQLADTDLDTLAGKTIAGTGTNIRLSTGTFATDVCVKVDSAGNFASAGAACGSGGGGVTVPLVLTPPSTDLSDTLTVTSTAGNGNRVRIGTQVGNANFGALYFGATTASATNYSLASDGADLYINGASNVLFLTGGSTRAQLTTLGLATNQIRFPLASSSVAIQQATTGVLEVNTQTAGQNAPLIVGLRDAATNTVGTGLTIRRQSSAAASTMAAGLGTSLLFQLAPANATPLNQDAGRLDVLWTDPANATRTAKIDMNVVVNGAMTKVGSWVPTGLQIAPGGFVELPDILAPASPAAGLSRLYKKTGGSVCEMNSAGTETCMGGGAPGGTTAVFSADCSAEVLTGGQECYQTGTPPVNYYCGLSGGCDAPGEATALPTEDAQDLQNVYDKTNTPPTITLGSAGLSVKNAVNQASAWRVCGADCATQKAEWYFHPTNGFTFELTPPQNTTFEIGDNRTLIYNTDTTEFMRIDEASRSIQYGSANLPYAPIYWSPVSVEKDGSNCVLATTAAVNGSEPLKTMTCQDNGRFSGQFIVPMSYSAGSAMNFRMKIVTVGVSSQPLAFDISGLCRGDGDTLNGTYGAGAAECNITTGTTANIIKECNVNFIPDGTCTPGDFASVRAVINNTRNGATASNAKILGGMINYAKGKDRE